MNENWRVIREWSYIGEVGCLYFFRIEDVYQRPRNDFAPTHPNVHPFVNHQGGPLQVMGDTPEELRERLKGMLAALDKPVLDWTPRRLVEVKREARK